MLTPRETYRAAVDAAIAEYDRAEELVLVVGNTTDAIARSLRSDPDCTMRIWSAA
jgi:hypothetical protein